MAARKKAKKAAPRKSAATKRAEAEALEDLRTRDAAALVSPAGELDLTSEAAWKAQPGEKVIVTDARGESHEAVVVAELPRTVVAELRDDLGTRIIASYNPAGGVSTFRSADGKDVGPLVPVPNTRLGREAERGTLERRDHRERKAAALDRLATREMEAGN